MVTAVPNEIARRTMQGVLWTSLGTGARGLLQLLVLSVLARLLAPRDFGVVAAAMVFVGLSASLAHFGFGPAIVQRPTLKSQHLRVAFSASVLVGVAAFALIWFIAPFVAELFHLGELRLVLRVMALLFLIQGLAIVAESLLQRNMRFGLLAGLDAASFAVGYGLIGVLLALLGYGFWAFVGASLGQAVVHTCLVLALQPHPMKPLLEWRTIAELLHFSGGFTLASIGNYVAGQGDSLVIGRWLGAEALGIYGRAYQLMTMPAMFVGDVLDRVLFPGMARLQHQRERLATAYRRAVALIALIQLPTSAGLFILAPEIIDVILGPNWGQVLVPFQVFAAGLLFRSSYKISDVTVKATGAVYQRAWRQAAFALLVIAGAGIGLRWGLPGAAAGVVGAIFVNFLLMAQLSLSLTGIPWRRFWAAHLPGVVLAGLIGAGLWLLASFFRAGDISPVLVLIISAGWVFLSLPLLFRYLPRLVLGGDGYWILQTIGSLFPRRLSFFDQLEPDVE